MATAPAPKAGGSILTRKFGPLPAWAWAGIGVGAFYLWRKRQAAAAAAAGQTATTTPATGLPTSNSNAPSGYGYQGAGVGAPYPTGAPAGAVAAAATPTNPYNVPTPTPGASGGTLQGAGYGGQPNNPYVADAAGNIYDYVSSPTQAAALQAAGQTLYFQSAPNVFTAGNPGNNTPLYQLTNPAQ
jgi:hypothetical protein